MGRSAGATLAAVHERRADAIAAGAFPACSRCGRPMVAGQDHLNAGAHFVCTGAVPAADLDAD